MVTDIESLITDLAFILILGAIVTILFKWIKQPVVLGYIVAGFLASPNFELLPPIANEANIEFWAELGIVVLLFSLGLEFNFKKLVNTGGSAIVTALITGGLALIGVIITNVSGNRKMQSQLEKSQAVTDTKLDELTREVREHNGFARRMPVVEEQIKVINHRINDLEGFHKPTH